MAESKPTDPANGTAPAEKFDWADEATTPVKSATDSKQDVDSSLSAAQTDGATSYMGGSENLDEPAFDVKVTLHDLQEDPNNPLYSVKTFDELNL